MSNLAAKIGDTVYTFDINRRIYKRDEKGVAHGGPVYREHWRPWVITGEEKRSWIVTYPEGSVPHKVVKTSFKTAAEVEDDCWIQSHKYQISRMIESCRDAAILRSIADLVGFAAEENQHG